MTEVSKPTNYSTSGVGSLNLRKPDSGRKSESSDSVGSSTQTATTAHAPAAGSSWIVDKDYLARLAILYGNAGREDTTRGKGQDDGTRSEVTVERSAPARTEPQSNLDKATAIAQQQLTTAAQNHDGWHEIMRQSYGDVYDYQQAEQLRQQTLAGDFSWMPDVQIVSADELNSGGGLHGGAYSADTNTIYISAELLDADPELAATVLLEELGHAIDTLVNVSDTQGDEGEIFGRLISGETLSESELAAIRAEDDSGTIIIGGVRVDVEYSGGIIDDIVGGISDFFSGVGDILSDAFSFVMDVVSDVWAAIKDVFMKVIMSEWFGWILTIMSFIPVLQFVALVIQIARAAYMVYQGIKHGSIAMVLGGIASVAGGLSKLGALAGASQGTINSLNNIASYASKAAAAYKAMSERDFGAALSLLSSEFADAELGATLDAVSRGYAVYQATKRGDVLGAIGLGASLLESIPGDNGDEILATVAQYADTIDKVVKAVETGDYSAAATLLNDTIGVDLGLSEETRAHFQKAADSLEKLAVAVEVLENGDYSQAATLLFDVAENYAPTEQAAAAFREAGETVTAIAETVELIEDGKFLEALNMLGAYADNDNPALSNLVSDLTNIAEAAQLIEDGQYTEALDKLGIDNPALSNLVSDLTNIAEAVQLIEDGKYADALDTLNIDSPALSGLVAGFTAVAEAAQLAEDGKYSEALDKLAEIHDGDLDNPALASLMADLERWVGGLDRINEAIENDDYIEAIEILMELAEIDADSGIRAMFADVVAARQYLLDLEAAIEVGAWALAIEAVRELRAQVSDPAMSALLWKLEDELVALAAEDMRQDLPRDTAAA